MQLQSDRLSLLEFTPDDWPGRPLALRYTRRRVEQNNYDIYLYSLMFI